MEPNAALVTPTGDGKVEVAASAQWPHAMHDALRRVLDVPKHKVLVKAPEAIGGAFGGKAFRNLHVGAAAAVAATVTNRPVKLVLDRNTDMVMTGGRPEHGIKYQVGFDDETR